MLWLVYLCGNMKIRDYIPFYKRNLKIAIPLVFAQVGQMTVQLVDNIMVGHVGTVELAAASFAGSVFINGFVFGMGFTFGLTPLVGRAFGRGKHREAGELFQNGLIANMGLGILLVALMGIIALFMDNMGQTAEVEQLSVPYYLTLVVSMLPFLLFFSFKQFAEGLGNTRMAMTVTLTANVINIILNYGLIYGKLGLPEMGYMGAAYATLIARSLMPLLFIFWFFRKRKFRKYFLFFRYAAFEWKRIMSLIKVGLPIGLQIMTEVLAFSLGSILMGWLGEVALAAHQIALSMASFTFMIANGVAMATTIRVAHQYGAKNYREMRYAVFASVHLAVLFMSCTALIFLVFRNELPRLFTTDPAVIAVAGNLFIMAGIFQVFDGVQVVALASLRGLADVKKPLVYAIFCYLIVSLPISYLFAFEFNQGPQGIWFGFVAGLGLAAILFFTRFNRRSRYFLSRT